jgi:NAD(P)-dependent dehydrogenase (short-subunit alcohol dehydrogenase family)
MFRLNGKVAVITGGASGIGRAVAELFAEVGARIAVFSRRTFEGEDLCLRISMMGGEAIHIQGDVTRADDVDRMVAAVTDRFGWIDILVNNAGIMRRTPLIDTEEDDWDAVLDTNLKGAYLCSKRILPGMIQRQSGVIVNIAGLLGLKGGAGSASAYAASKGALVTLTKSLAVRHGKDGVRVNCISPGFVPTDLNRSLIEEAPDPEERRRDYESGYPLGRLGRPEDVAYAALYLASSEAGWVTGANLVVDGGLLAK